MEIISAEKPEFSKSGDINLVVAFGLPRPVPDHLEDGPSAQVIFDPMEPVPFTASPNDCEPHGVELYNRAMAGEFGHIAPYVEPPVTPAQKQAEARAEARAYLTKTDWYVTRKLETGAEIPADIAKARQTAREALN